MAEVTPFTKPSSAAVVAEAVGAPLESVATARLAVTAVSAITPDPLFTHQAKFVPLANLLRAIFAVPAAAMSALMIFPAAEAERGRRSAIRRLVSLMSKMTIKFVEKRAEWPS